MVRLRLPGGRIGSGVLRRLAELSHEYGNGILQLTSRAGLQVRGLPDPLPAEFVAAVTATGLLPVTTHERVRNIVASPLTGLSGGLADLGSVVAELDAGLVAVPALADLPGRFLFVLDDGRGDVIDLRFDLGFQATGPDAGLVLVGSADRGSPVRTSEAVPTLLRLARDFLVARTTSGAWHVADLADWLDSLDLRPVRPVHAGATIPLGRIADAASVSVPLARLSLTQARIVEQICAGGPVVITPWRGLVLPSAADRLDVLQYAGFLVDDDTGWSQVSACVGSPFCGKALIDTTAVTSALVRSVPALPRVHVSGCGRRCGAPVGDHLHLVAPTAGYALQVVGDRP